MNIPSSIANNLKACFEGSNWTGVSIADTTKDITWQQAQQRTTESPNTIASLLHHLYYWNGIIMQRIKGDNPSIPEANGFDVNELKDERNWNDLIEETHQSFIQLADAITNFPEEKLTDTYASGKSSYYANLQGIVEHAYYHLGQMVILKKQIKKSDLP